LVRFNTNVDNQKKSVGAADKAVKDLGGTVSAQVSSIINNIGNAARALDTVLAPSLENILGTINSILTQANKALAAFSDVAVGDVNRALFDFSAGATTGSLGAPAFEALRKSVSQLNPAIAQSEQDLEKYTRALSDVEVQLQRIGPNAGAGFLKLQEDVNKAISAQTNAILARKAALAQAGVKPKATETDKPDPNLDRVNKLLTQLEKTGPKTAKAAKDFTDFAVAGLDPTLKAEQSFARQVIQLTNGNMLLQARLEGGEKEEQQRQRIEEIIESAGFKDAERINNARETLQTLFDQTNALTEQERVAKRQRQLFESIGATIKSGIVDTIMSAIDGTKTLGESLSGLLKQLGGMFLQAGVSQIGKGLKIPGFANGGSIPGGKPAIVGERGPELFVPSRSGRIVPNHAMGGVGSITVNVDATGSSVQGNAEDSKRLGDAIGLAIRQELIKQKRPGGLLG